MFIVMGCLNLDRYGVVGHTFRCEFSDCCWHRMRDYYMATVCRRRMMEIMYFLLLDQL